MLPPALITSAATHAPRWFRAKSIIAFLASWAIWLGSWWAAERKGKVPGFTHLHVQEGNESRIARRRGNVQKKGARIRYKS
jgi:hypothetical protein